MELTGHSLIVDTSGMKDGMTEEGNGRSEQSGDQLA